MKNNHTYHSGTIKSLYGHSGNRCAFPGCMQELTCNEGINISEICHIYGLNRDSARYEDGFTQDFLNSEQNLILLCRNHHAIIDAKENEKKYSVQVLLNMKATHEADVKARMSDQIVYNENEYFCDYLKIKRKLRTKYDIDLRKKDIENIGEIFSHQNSNVRIVMKKILDIMHRNQEYKRFYESGSINMMMVLNELKIEIWSLAQMLQYLEFCELIEECKYQPNNLNSYIEDEFGNTVDLSNDYVFKIQSGIWHIKENGMVLDAIYCEQGDL